MPALSALSPTVICNMALSRLFINTLIQSIDPPDPSIQAQQCAFWYPICRDQLLRSAPWNFAFTSLVLAPDATVFPGWRYAYQYPNDCLQMIAVTTSAGQRTSSSLWAGYWWPAGGAGWSIPKIPTKLVQSQVNQGQLAILCDLPSSVGAPVYLFYIQCVDNVAQFDVLFSNALADEIASNVGGPLGCDPQIVMDCRNRATLSRAKALAQVLNETQQDRERQSPSVLAR